jgi:hypothetical protein
MDVSGNEIYFSFVYSVLKNASIVDLVSDYKNKVTHSIIEDLYDHIFEFIDPNRVLIIGNQAENEKKKF